MEKIIILDDKKIPIQKEKTFIGRSSECDIQLNDEQISRKHAVIHSKGDEIYFEDLGSSNGSYLNNKLVTTRKKIKEGDVIQIGTFVLKVDLFVPTRRYPALETGAIEDGIKCKKCGKTVTKDAKFCMFCGAPLKQLIKVQKIDCPKCGQLNSMSAQFCVKCGVDLTEETSEIDLSEQTPVFMSVESAQETQDLAHLAADQKTSAIADSKKDKKPSKEAAPDKKKTPKKPEKVSSRPAGFWIRTLAQFIDGILFTLILTIILAPVTYALITYYAKIKLNFSALDIQTVYNAVQSMAIMYYSVVSGIIFILSILYYPVLWTKNGVTPGKKICGIKIVKSDGTEKIGFGTALGRYLSYYLSAIPIFIGFLMIAFSKNKSGIHDKLAKTAVIHYR